MENWTETKYFSLSIKTGDYGMPESIRTIGYFDGKTMREIHTGKVITYEGVKGVYEIDTRYIFAKISASEVVKQLKTERLDEIKYKKFIIALEQVEDSPSKRVQDKVFLDNHFKTLNAKEECDDFETYEVTFRKASNDGEYKTYAYMRKGILRDIITDIPLVPETASYKDEEALAYSFIENCSCKKALRKIMHLLGEVEERLHVEALAEITEDKVAIKKYYERKETEEETKAKDDLIRLILEKKSC